jgi:hypothetical protein
MPNFSASSQFCGGFLQLGAQVSPGQPGLDQPNPAFELSKFALGTFDEQHIGNAKSPATSSVSSAKQAVKFPLSALTLPFFLLFLAVAHLPRSPPLSHLFKDQIF